MKISKAQILLCLVVTLLISACGGEKIKEKKIEKVIESRNLAEMNALKNELSNKQHQLSEKLNKLSKAIDELDSNKSMPLVSAYTIESQKFKHHIEVQASFNSDKNVVLFPEYNGMLTDVLVDEDEKVKKGQLLATIDDGGLSEQLVQAEVQENLAKTTFERQKRLWKQDIGSEMQYLQAKAKYEGQQKVVGQLRAQLEKTKIRAPFSGVIDEIMVEEGNMVAAGGMQSIMRIINLDEVYAKADVPEGYIGAVAEGTAVKVIVPVLNDTIATKVSQVGNYIKPENRTFRVEAKVSNKNWKIKPNMNAKLNIIDYVADSAIIIPQNVVSEDAEGNKYVYLITNKKENTAKVKRVFVTIGKSEGKYVEVLEGLEKGAQILDEGSRMVIDGQAVEIIK